MLIEVQSEQDTETHNRERQQLHTPVQVSERHERELKRGDEGE